MAAIASEIKMSAEVQEYLRKAEAQDAEAQFALGLCFDKGRGVVKDEKQAVELFCKAAEQGYALAQFALGVCFDKGRGVAKDERQAVEWYRKAAEQGHAKAQCVLGVSFANGLGVAKDEKQAVEWFRKAAEQEYAGAQYKLGVSFEKGLGVIKDEKQAVEWFRKAAEQGYDLAQYNLGCAFRDGQGVAKDEKQAVEWYRKAAEQGYADAQFNLGLCFATGVAKDERQAVEWYRKAAEQGHKNAQYNLGVCFANGLGVTKDEKQAVECYRKAAEQGDADAQYNLGCCFDKGDGVAKDEKQAVMWYQKAAEQGHTEAQFNLGWCFQIGRGVAKDERQAVVWYRKAAEQGDADAQFALGFYLAEGRGVTKDKSQAMVWYRKAAEQGHAKAKRALERLQSSMTRAEKEACEKAQKLKEQEEQLRRQREEFEAKKKAEEGLLKEQAAALAKKQAQLLEEERKKQDEKQKAETKTQQEKPIAIPSLSTVPRIAWKEIVLGELVGNGSYGDVYKGQWQGAPVAIKVLQLKTLSKPMTEEFEHESDMMMKCQHPSIVRLYGVCTEPGHLAMVMDYLPTSLRTRLQDGKDFPWLKRLLIAQDMAKGLAYLHSRNILHRDLKSFNILLDENERARIADFGLAKVKLEIGSTSTKTHKAVGSLRWRAPELFDFPPPESNAASDVYSLGMLLWELVTRRLPYSHSSDESMVAAWIGSGKKEKIPDDCPKAFAEIIQDCWAAPDKRPKASEVVARLEPLVKEAATKESSLQKPLTVDEFRMFTADFAVFAARQEASSNPTFMPLTPFRDATSRASQAGTSPLGAGQESKSTVAKP